MERIDTAQSKAAALTEALPYIQDFRGSVVLIKLGGSVMESEAKLANENFVAHAPEAVVAEARRKLAENKEKVAQLEKLAKLFA